MSAVLLVVFYFAWLAVSDTKKQRSPEVATQASNQEKPDESIWSPSTWSPGTFLTWALVIIGGIQTRVFYVQARRLRETIDKMDEISRGQTADMENSIFQAARAATAMENFVAQIKLQVVELTEQTTIAKRSLVDLERPYVFVFGIGRIGRMIINGDTRPELTFSVANFGKTPAILTRVAVTIDGIAIGDEPLPPETVHYVHDLVLSPILGPQEKREKIRIDLRNMAGLFIGMIEGPDDNEERANAENYDWFAIKARDIATYIYIIIEYDGPFTRGHQTSGFWTYDYLTFRFFNAGGDRCNYTR